MSPKTVVFTLLLTMALTFGCETKPPADITDPGQLLFLGYAKKDVNCSRCHGPEGQGTNEGPDIRKAYAKFGEKRIIEIIEAGKGDEDDMPPFNDKLDNDELSSLLKFLKSIQVDSLARH